MYNLNICKYILSTQREKSVVLNMLNFLSSSVKSNSGLSG